MPMKAKGTTVTFSSTSASVTGNVVSVGPPGMTIEKIKTTHMGSTGVTHDFIFADFAENSPMRMVVEFEGQVSIPIGTTGTIGLELPNGHYWTWGGGIESFEPSDINVEGAERWEAAVDIAVLGDVTRSTST